MLMLVSIKNQREHGTMSFQELETENINIGIGTQQQGNQSLLHENM